MKRDVSTHLDVQIHADTELEFQIAVARQPGIELSESLTFELNGWNQIAREVPGPHGARIHVLRCGAGNLQAHYSATVIGAALADPPSEYDLSLYSRPSRFAESDRLLAFAATEFGCGIDNPDAPARIADWVGRRIRYTPGSSTPSDGAVETLLSGAGVCRDFAHLTVALLRAIGVPARVASAYAPGIVPMDFHSVPEAYVRGAWQVFDPTRLAPRSALARIATGRDASDIAFLGNHGGDISINGLWVNAFIDGPLPFDDFDHPLTLA
ncbi:transglutaminase [Nocardia sp. SYP-A9097]|uniref:transglutaminase-like domain-containing protein n=1 Tax=Nocardia sp. SYP-A9097 TaxID=2663237 RepID=UPI0013220B6E|nr:transglutaminase family protein [Nocardia sp. SYP-A9097]MRH88185.1 transglutaminase [Nocardia sp. SYP-A9097]